MFVQRAINRMLRKHYEPTAICHSFIRSVRNEKGAVISPGRTIATNAYAHLGIPPDSVSGVSAGDSRWRRPRSAFSTDLEEAFPSITKERVFQIFQRVTGDPWTAEVFTWLATWNGSIPQGAPTSPILLNIALRELDLVLGEQWSRGNFRITRYVDDITLTATKFREVPVDIQRELLDQVESFGFRINDRKTVSHRVGDQMYIQITGVNLLPEEWQIALSRRVLERFRLLLYHSRRVLISTKHVERDSDGNPADPELRELEVRARGFIGGVLAVVRQVYQNRVPPRLVSAVKTAKVIGFDHDPTLADPNDEDFYHWDYMTDEEISIEELNAEMDNALGNFDLVEVSH